MFLKCNAKSARIISATLGDGRSAKVTKISIAPGETKEVKEDVLIAAMEKNVVMQSWFDNGELVKVNGPSAAPASKDESKGSKGGARSGSKSKSSTDGGSKGDGKSKNAYRARTRPPSFVNYQAFSKMVEGSLIADAVAVLGSLNIIAAELDR